MTYINMDHSTGIGLIVPLIFYPTSKWANEVYTKLQEQVMAVSDEKTHKVTELLHAIKQVKFSASEAWWRDVIMRVRSKELKIWRREQITGLFIWASWASMPTLLGAAALVSYGLFNGQLPASVAFTALSLLGQLETSFNVLPHAITLILNARVSMRRIEEHMNRTEKAQYLEDSSEIKLEDATLSWTHEDSHEDSAFKLTNVNLCFPTGKLR